MLYGRLGHFLRPDRGQPPRRPADEAARHVQTGAISDFDYSAKIDIISARLTFKWKGHMGAGY